MKRYTLSLFILLICSLVSLSADNSASDSIILSGGVIAGSDTVCYNSSPVLIRSVSSASGCTGPTSYQWQDSVSGRSWRNISNAKSATYQPGNLSVTTFYRRKASNDTCMQVAFSNVVCVVVRNQITAPVLSQYLDTLCYGTTPNPLSIQTPSVAGVGDSISYQWQYSVNNRTWSDIPNATGLTYQPSALTQSRYFRVKATSAEGCGTFTSNAIKVNVYPDLQLSVTGCAPLCYMANGVVSVSATGAGNRYGYKWQELTAGQWNDIGTNSSQLNTPSKAEGDYSYRCIVTPLSGCQQDTSATITVKVYADLSAGSISNTDTICYNTQPGVIQSVAPASGCDSLFVYQWEYSTDSIAWSAIPNTNSITYQPSALSQSTYYRRKASNLKCGTIGYSNVVKVEVRCQIFAPVVAQYADTICYNAIPGLLSITTPSIAGVGDSITYQWQESSNNQLWNDIPDATALTYQPSALTQSRFFRVKATSSEGCGTYISNAVKVNVYPDLQLSVTGCAPLCYLANGVVRVSATGAGNRYSYQWQELAAGQWSNLGTNSLLLTTPSKPEGNYAYRCIVTPLSGCQQDTSSTIAVEVYADLSSGSIFNDDTLCYNTQPGIIQSVSSAAGCDSVYVYQWEYSTDNVTWSVIPYANSTTYQPSALTQTTYYRRKVSNSRCGVFAYSNVAVVMVRGQMTYPVVGQYLDTICYNSVPNELDVTVPSIPELGDTIHYQWQESANGNSWNDILGETQLVYQPPALANTHYYRVVAISSDGCGARSSNAVKVNVYPDLVITNNPVDTICYMTSTQLTFTAAGEGGRYAYQWQESTDSVNFTDIRNERRSDYWTDDLPDGKYFYRCIVSPLSGCSSDTSDVFVVNVYAEFCPGSLAENQELCKYEDAQELVFKENPVGGEMGRYSYQWEYSLDLVSWNDVANETSVAYTPRNMQQTTYYRVRVRNSCDLGYTDTIEVFVNPLPDTVIIAGTQTPCYNQYEYYDLGQMDEGFDYQWSLDDSSVGEIVTNPSNKEQVRVLWTAASSSANLILTVTNVETGCLSRNYYPITTSSEKTPDTTIIVRKPNSNILVCQDSVTDHYQWGSTERSTGNEKVFDDTDRRYCQVEGGIDTSRFVYWLDLWNGSEARCVSRSIYSSSNDEKYVKQPTQNISVVSSVRDAVTIAIDNPSAKDVTVRLYTTAGVELLSQPLGKEQSIKADLPVSVPSGVYMLRVEIGTDCETIKLIAE